MLFNSIDFAIFLPIIFILYWLALDNLKTQNLLVLIASYIFYAWWDWRFLGLIVFSTTIDYTIGRRLGKEKNRLKRKILLWISIVINISFLGFFKYYNFFLDNFLTAFSFFGAKINVNSLNIILPVGISFYTFQTLSYTIDVYKQKLNPTKDLIAFSAFVSFFPQLVAGPIERATNLLPQFYNKRTFEESNAVNGMRQILWGLFKKIVIADNCAKIANIIFANSGDYSGSTLVLGATFFTFQIYGDFSGYSDIAIGTARLFGFNLIQNFAFPYFSRDIAEFWRRWHISLSTWFRDYLYIPLGGSRGSTLMKVRNTFILFIISGFWHGANWTFIVWGGLHALYFLPLLLTKRNRNHIEAIDTNKLLPSFKEFCQILFTFCLVTFAWIFFRAENISHAIAYINGIFTSSIMDIPDFPGRKKALITLFIIILFMIIEWNGRSEQYGIAKLGMQWKRQYRYTLYFFLISCLFWFGGNDQQFIYFQF